MLYKNSVVPLLLSTMIPLEDTQKLSVTMGEFDTLGHDSDLEASILKHNTDLNNVINTCKELESLVKRSRAESRDSKRRKVE